MAWLFNPFERTIRAAVNVAVRDAAAKVMERYADARQVDDLKKEIVKLEIERDKKVEEFARKEREVEHKVGLERKRQEFEIAQAKRETKLEIQQGNLEADKKRFADQSEFERKHLQAQIESLNAMVNALMKRLPSAEIIANIGGKG